MEVMFSNNPNNGFFDIKQFVGFYGEISDLEILIDNLDKKVINKKYKVKKYLSYNKDYFDILDLDKEFLNKKIDDLSMCEYKLMLLIMVIEEEPKLIVLNYFDVGFNGKFKRKIIKLIKLIRASLGINFVVISNDVVFVNKVVKHVVVCNKKIIKFQGKVLDAIKEGYIEEPPIYDFIKLANDKGANLEYTLDSKDLLKDIYRSVF